MKKILGIIAVTAVLAACNNSASNTDNKKDSIDSAASVKKEAIDSAAEKRKDQVDSVANQKKETVDKMDSLNKKDSTKSTKK